jgi:hypothetical protein
LLAPLHVLVMNVLEEEEVVVAAEEGVVGHLW